MIYSNGNAKVSINEVGRRVVEWPDGEALQLDYPLSIDLNISNRCSNGCPYCYAGNTPYGRTANLLELTYLYDMLPGSEIAINIQYPLPENFELWLLKMKQQGVIVNGTINQIDLEQDNSIIDQLAKWQEQGLLHGIGISFRSFNKELYSGLNVLKHVVIHTIVGIHSLEDIQLMLDRFNVLVLGYKYNERGVDYFNGDSTIEANIHLLHSQVPQLLESKGKGVLCFDTKALDQLDVRSVFPADKWDTYYQGDEGTISFYVDAVGETFNTDSHTDSEPFDIKIQLDDGSYKHLSVREMFSKIKERKSNEEN